MSDDVVPAPTVQLPRLERLSTAHAPCCLVAGRRETIRTIGGHYHTPPISSYNWLKCLHRGALVVRIGYLPCHFNTAVTRLLTSDTQAQR